MTVIDAGGITHPNLHEVGKDESLELHNICVQVLPEGAHYSLSERKPLVLEGATRRD